MTTSCRERLIETACRLFYRNGCHATGIDRILADAGVAKMTLYKHFRSKEELILAAVRRMDEHTRNRIVRGVERRSREPRARLLALVEVVAESTQSGNFYGCPFVNIAAEYACADHPIHHAVGEHKRLLLEYIATLAVEAGAAEPQALARQLHLVIEGMMAMVHATGDVAYTAAARAAAETVLAHGLQPG